MKLLRLAAWTVWFMLAWISLASAEPVSMLIAGIAGVLKAGGIGAMLIKAAFGIALQVGASLLQKAMTKNRPQAQPGISGQLQVGGTNSLSFIVGDYATAGSLEYTGEWGSVGGTPNAYHVQVITLSDLPQGGIGRRVWINGQQCEINLDATPTEMGYPVVEFRQGGRDHFWIKFLGGAQAASDAYLLNRFGAHAEKPWQSDMIGRGCTVVIMTALVNRQLLTQLPSGRFEPLPLALYDPRKDSTVGGSGPQRWGVPSTYEPTRNNAVVIYNILRGISHEGELLYGPAIPATRLPLANWFAAMNECDLPVDGAAQFRCGYEIKVGENQPLDVIQELLKGCNGRIAEVGGIYKIHVGAPALPAAFITDDDFVVTEEQELDPFPGLESTFNGATASYPDPDAGWEMKDAPQRLFPDYEAEDDGRRLLADFQFNAVPFPLQVQRLMKSMVEDGRRFRKHRGMLGPWAFALEPLDTIGWTSPREGYVSKLFQLESMDDQVNANQAVAFRETDPGDFDWNFSTDGLPWSVGPLVPQWPVAQPVTGWQVLPAEFRDASDNARRPSIEIRFDGKQEDVRAVRVTVRLAASGSTVFDGELPYGVPVTNPETRGIVINAVFLPDTAYQVQGEFVPYSARATTPTSWLSVTTPNIRLGDSDVFLPGMEGELKEALGAATDWIGPHYRALVDEARRLTARIVDQDTRNYDDKKKLLVEIQSASDRLTASYRSEIEVATGPNSALSRRVETLEIAMPGKASIALVDALAATVSTQGDIIELQGTAITDIQLALPGKASTESVFLLGGRLTDAEGEIDTLSSALLGVETSVGRIAASGRLFIEAAANPVDGWAQIGLRTSANNGTSFEEAAILLQSRLSGSPRSRVLLKGAQTSIVDTNNNVLALFDETGTYFNTARVNIPELMTSSAFVEHLRITDSLQLDPGVVVTGSIAEGAIYNKADAYISRTGTGNYLPFVVGRPAAAWDEWLTVTINSPSLYPILFFCGFNVFASSAPNSSSGPPGIYLEIKAQMNGVDVPGLYLGASAAGYGATVTLQNSFMAMPATAQTSNTIKILGRIRNNYPGWDSNTLAQGTITLVAQCGKV